MMGEMPDSIHTQDAPYMPRHAVGYIPRHAALDDPPMYEEVVRDLGDPTWYGRGGRPYYPKHLRPEDDPYSTAYYIPVTDISELVDDDLLAGASTQPDQPPPPVWQELQDFRDSYETTEPSHKGDALPEDGQTPACQVGCPRCKCATSDHPTDYSGEDTISIRSPLGYEAPYNPEVNLSDLTLDAISAASDRYPRRTRPKPPGFWERIARVSRRIGAAVSSFFNNPEKGRRRQVVAVLGAIALMGTTVWLFGHPPM